MGQIHELAHLSEFTLRAAGTLTDDGTFPRMTSATPTPMVAPAAQPAPDKNNACPVQAFAVRLSTCPRGHVAALEEAVTAHPSLAPSLTATAVKANQAHFFPELISRAVRSTPDQAAAIVRSAANIAPRMAPAIAMAAIRAAPPFRQAIEDAALAAAPSYSVLIRQAVSALGALGTSA